MKDGKGFSGSIGGSRGASEIKSGSIVEADGKYRECDPNRGAGSNIAGGKSGGGAYGRVPVSAVDPKVRGSGPMPASPVRQPSKGK